MDDIPLCPPYWPELIWQLVHNVPPPPDPDPDPVYRTALFKRWDSHFAGLAVEALATHISDERMSREIGELVSKAIPDPEPWLSGSGGRVTSGR
jgi:hypothetical protein